MPNPVLTLTLQEAQPPAITIAKPHGGDPLFWTRLQSELGSFGRGSNTAFVIPAEKFLGSRRLVKALCAQYGVGIRTDSGARDLLIGAAREENALASALSDLKAVPETELVATLQASRFSRVLRPFQRRDVAHLLALPHGANFSVPGAGKTTVTYAVYEIEVLRGRVGQMLVIAPLSAFDAWVTEADQCFLEPPKVAVFEPNQPIRSDTEVLLVNYSKLIGHYPALSSWARNRSTHAILDEAHRMKKGRAGAWGAASLDMAWHAARRDILTGTPAPQHPRDLEALFDFVWPGQARRILPEAAFQPQSPPDIGSIIAEDLNPLFVRTRKSELNLRTPEKRVLRLELQGLQREIYLTITNQYSGEIPISRNNRRELARWRRVVMYLLEAASNPALLPLGWSEYDPPVYYHPRFPIPPNSALVHLLNQYGRYETPAKFRKLAEIVETNAQLGRKTLIWSSFVRNLESLKQMFARYEPAIIHGGISATEANAGEITRQAEIARFRNNDDCMILLANPAAMSEGISLHHTCHDAIYLERTFNAGQYLQSVDRIHRLGLDPAQETRITFLVTKDTIDEVVYQRVEHKASLLSQMLNDPDIISMALPDEEDLEDVETGLGQPIDDDDDVTALLAHLRGG